jgi:hypothetical protein
MLICSRYWWVAKPDRPHLQPRPKRAFVSQQRKECETGKADPGGRMRDGGRSNMDNFLRDVVFQVLLGPGPCAISLLTLPSCLSARCSLLPVPVKRKKRGRAGLFSG